MDEEREQAAEWGEKSRKGRFTEVIWRPNTREEKWEVKVLQKKRDEGGNLRKTSKVCPCHSAASVSSSRREKMFLNKLLKCFEFMFQFVSARVRSVKKVGR